MATDKLIRDTEAAEILACSRATFWRRVNDGTFEQPIRIGGMTRWRLSDIEAFMAGLSKAAPAPSMPETRTRKRSA